MKLRRHNRDRVMGRPLLIEVAGTCIASGLPKIKFEDRNFRWGGVDDPACVECHKPESFNSGALIEGALPRLLAYLHIHLHVHEHL